MAQYSGHVQRNIVMHITERTVTMHKGLPLYEGDSLIRSGRLPGAETLHIIEREARELRARTIWMYLERFANWVEHAVWKARQRDVARFLSRATDHADLERRMKALDQGNHATVG